MPTQTQSLIANFIELLSSPRHFAQALSFGTQWVEAPTTEGRAVRFRFWAPDCAQLSIEINHLLTLPMQRMADGWFEAVVACQPGDRYRYRLPSGQFVPDPASRAQDGDVHDCSIVIDPEAYTWRNHGWCGRPWHETVLYELHVGLMGGYKGVQARLPELAAIGITAIELMPIADFPGARNWGYDGVLSYAPEASYGTPDELKALIDAAHDLGMMVFLDVVYNHFGPEGNALHAYASAFFRDDQKTPWGPAIDFRRAAVRNFFIENALYWLNEYRFDGLRFDAVHAISEKDFLRELAQRVRAETDHQRHIHLVLENDDNAASLLGNFIEHSIAYSIDEAPGIFDAQWNDDAHHAMHVLLTGEREGYYADYAHAPAAMLARCLSEGFGYQGDFSMLRKNYRGEVSMHLHPISFVFFLQNHDQIGNRAYGERLTALCPPEALRAAIALQLLTPHIPMIFMDEEWGSQRPFPYFTSYTGALADAVREGRQNEFSHFSAFGDAEQRAHIPDPNAVETYRLAQADEEERHSDAAQRWRDNYRELLMLRQRVITPCLHNVAALGAEVLGTHAVLARWHLAEGIVLAIYSNLGSQPALLGPVHFPVSVSIAVPTPGECFYFVLYETEQGLRSQLEAGQLPPYSSVVLIETRQLAAELSASAMAQTVASGDVGNAGTHAPPLRP